MSVRLAVVVSHPIQYFAPWYREIAKLEGVDLRVFFCCDWGLNEYVDPQFKRPIKWDIPLLEGYPHEFLPIGRRPTHLTFRQVDNPQVDESLDRFDPDVVQVSGYAHRTHWRVAAWSRARRRPLLIFSDSNAGASRTWWKRAAKKIIVRRFYSRVDGALCVGENNRQYHMQYGLTQDRLFQCAFPIDRDRLLASVPDRPAARRKVRREHGIPEDAFVLMLCGKYVAHKRPLDLVAAAWHVAQRGAPVWSLLVGEGPERASIEELCQREGVKNAVLTGFVNQSRIAEYYAASDALVIPSEREPYGLVAAEAACFSLPLIVSDRVGCIGAADVARPGVNALTYPCGELKTLEDIIEKLCLDRQLYLRMAESSSLVSELQSVSVAAESVSEAARRLRRMGPR